MRPKTAGAGHDRGDRTAPVRLPAALLGRPPRPSASAHTSAKPYQPATEHLTPHASCFTPNGGWRPWDRLIHPPQNSTGILKGDEQNVVGIRRFLAQSFVLGTNDPGWNRRFLLAACRDTAGWHPLTTRPTNQGHGDHAPLQLTPHLTRGDVVLAHRVAIRGSCGAALRFAIPTAP